jgi:hypothetical protein
MKSFMQRDRSVDFKEWVLQLIHRRRLQNDPPLKAVKLLLNQISIVREFIYVGGSIMANREDEKL